jgi:UDP-2-acetamido-3-amino-2,3-dideoxy-glucuronate N-acetyltransferase
MVGKISQPNIAVVGVGYWGQNLVRNFHQLGALKVICDINPERLQSFRKKYPGIPLNSSFSQILNDPSIKGIVIATPAGSHYEMAMKSLLAGKDVLVEKPLALKVKEGADLVQVAARDGRILMVGHILQYHPGILKLKELINCGELGKIQYVYSNRLNLGKFRPEENILWSFAPHDISVMLSLLNEEPESVATHGGSYLQPHIVDVTLTTLTFPSGVKGHIFVSWLHPYKDQKLIVVGDRKMAVFDGVANNGKLILYPHKVEWIDRIPVGKKAEGEEIPIEPEEPLKRECLHFLECIQERKNPRTDGREGLRVLQILQASQESLDHNGQVVYLSTKASLYTLPPSLPSVSEEDRVSIHPSAVIEEPCEIGEGTKIWHFCHILPGTRIGKNCNLGQNVVVGPNVTIGNGVKIQNNVSVYEGVTLEDGVFCGPSMVFTNVINPRAHIIRKHEYKPTLVKQGATLGANCTILCGNVIGRYAMIGAGAVVTHDVPDYALVLGNPARLAGWVCQCGEKLPEHLSCEKCGGKYILKERRLIPYPA